MPAAVEIDLSAIPEDQREAVAALLRERGQLKDEAASLKDETAILRSETAILRSETAGLKDIIKRLEHLVAELNHLVHGKRSEKLSEDERQLAFEDLETAVAEANEQKETQAPSDSTSRRTASSAKRNRGNLPEDLPRIEQVVEPDSLACPCGCGQMHKIGEDRTERLDIVPAQLRVLVTVRPKYACRACTDGVRQAPAPAALIESGLPTEGLIAHILVSKYADHLPLYRQSQILSRSGVDIHRSTLADWVGVAAFHLRPVVARLAEHGGASHILVSARRPSDPTFFCTLISLSNTVSFSDVDLLSAKSRYDPDSGLTVIIPVRIFDGEAFVDRTLTAVINREPEEVETRLEG